jgi:hypothetical protein
MIPYVFLLIFGWVKTPERVAQRGMEFIEVFLRELGMDNAREIPAPCLRALAQLAYRRATKMPNGRPCLFRYFSELRRASEAVYTLVMIRYGPPIDVDVRSLLLWHGVEGVFQMPPKPPDPPPATGVGAA